MEQLIFSSVENLPHARASAAFTEPKPVFKEDGEILATQASKDATSPTVLSDKMKRNYVSIVNERVSRFIRKS